VTDNEITLNILKKWKTNYFPNLKKKRFNEIKNRRPASCTLNGVTSAQLITKLY